MTKVSSVNPGGSSLLRKLVLGIASLGTVAGGGLILNDQHQTNQAVKAELEGVKTALSKKIGLEDIPHRIKEAEASVFMTYDVIDGKRVEKDGWTSSIVKIDGKHYKLDCAHSNKDIVHFLTQELELEAFDKSATFRMIPGPLEDGSIGFFPEEDISICNVDISKLPRNRRNIGLELEDITEMPRHGTSLFALGNSPRYPRSSYVGFTVHPDRTIEDDDGKVFKNQLEHFAVNRGTSGAAAVNIETKKLSAIVIAGEEGEKGCSPKGFSVGMKSVKPKLHGLGLNVFSEKEKKELFGGNLPPRENDAMNIKTLRALKGFPLPQASTPLEHLVTVGSYFNREK